MEGILSIIKAVADKLRCRARSSTSSTETLPPRPWRQGGQYKRPQLLNVLDNHNHAFSDGEQSPDFKRKPQRLRRRGRWRTKNITLPSNRNYLRRVRRRQQLSEEVSSDSTDEILSSDASPSTFCFEKGAGFLHGTRRIEHCEINYSYYAD